MTAFRVPWGCWTCGSAKSRVIEADHDDDGIRVRLVEKPEQLAWTA